MLKPAIRFFGDLAWAVRMFRARRFRRWLLFSQRERFDDAFRPYTSDMARIAYPGAVYHAGRDDMKRARRYALRRTEEQGPLS